ncbi:MAG: hypothetical protein JXC36_01690 [Candidatus Atribacteria bacterium]|nr:hypothetical protein [Candidatus Atribacteria bacterium]
MPTFIKTEIKPNNHIDLLLKEKIPVYSFPVSVLLKMEKEILGIYASIHPLSYYRKQLTVQLLPGQNLIRSHHIAQLKNGQSTLIAGLLIQARRQYTKHREVMAFLLLEDETDLFEAIAFPEIFRQYFSLLTKDALLLIRGIVNNQNGDIKIVIQEIKDIYSYFKKKM